MLRGLAHTGAVHFDLLLRRECEGLMLTGKAGEAEEIPSWSHKAWGAQIGFSSGHSRKGKSLFWLLWVQADMRAQSLLSTCYRPRPRGGASIDETPDRERGRRAGDGRQGSVLGVRWKVTEVNWSGEMKTGRRNGRREKARLFWPTCRKSGTIAR